MSEKPQAFINPASGSIRLTGEVDFVDAEGNLIESIDAPKLCGCGLSKEKPRCDGSHKEYVKLFAEALRNARELVKPCISFAPMAKRAHAIRENELAYRIEAGETVVGVKVGGALDSPKSAEPTNVMIFGYLTDAMQLTDSIKTANYIYPRAEAEVAFKISKEVSTEIQPSEVLDYVSHVATAIEIFDYRYGQAQIYANDAIADNAGAAAFVYSHWVPAHEANLENLTAQVFKNEDEIDNWFCLPPETLQLILLIDFGYFNSNMSSYGYNPVVIQNFVGLLSSRTSAGSNLSSKLVAHFISIL